MTFKQTTPDVSHDQDLHVRYEKLFKQEGRKHLYTCLFDFESVFNEVVHATKQDQLAGLIKRHKRIKTKLRKNIKIENN